MQKSPWTQWGGGYLTAFSRVRILHHHPEDLRVGIVVMEYRPRIRVSFHSPVHDVAKE
jgi:hypothetical protein